MFLLLTKLKETDKPLSTFKEGKQTQALANKLKSKLKKKRVSY